METGTDTHRNGCENKATSVSFFGIWQTANHDRTANSIEVSSKGSQDKLTTEDTFVFLQHKMSGRILSINTRTLWFWDFVLE